jgi:hypothetical protein
MKRVYKFYCRDPKSAALAEQVKKAYAYRHQLVDIVNEEIEALEAARTRCSPEISICQQQIAAINVEIDERLKEAKR